MDEEKINFAKYSYNKPCDPITEWCRDHEIDDKLIYKGAATQQICFIRDTIPSIFASSHEEYVGIQHRMRIESCHMSKSVTLPVYQIVFQGCEFVLRGNFHDWKISVHLPYWMDNLSYLDFDGLFDPNAKINYCEGFHKNQIYGSFNDYIKEVSDPEKTYPNRKFTIEILNCNKLYTFFYILFIRYIKGKMK